MVETITIGKDELKKIIRKAVHDSRSYLNLSSAYIAIIKKTYPDSKTQEYAKIIIDSHKKSQDVFDTLFEDILAKAVQNPS